MPDEKGKENMLNPEVPKGEPVQKESPISEWSFRQVQSRENKLLALLEKARTLEEVERINKEIAELASRREILAVELKEVGGFDDLNERLVVLRAMAAEGDLTARDIRDELNFVKRISDDEERGSPYAGLREWYYKGQLEKLGKLKVAVPPKVSQEETRGLAEEMRKMRELSQVGMGELSGAVREEFEKNPEKWLRGRLERLESLEWEFENPINRPILTEIVAAFPVLNKENPMLVKEFWARYGLHNYALALKNAPDIETALSRAGSISRESFDLLFKIRHTKEGPAAVAEAFRAYEKYGDKIIIQKGNDLEVWRNKVALVVASMTGEVAPDSLSDLSARQLKEEEKEICRKWRWAQRIAENLWFTTGRAAYFDAWRLPESKQLFGEGTYILKRIFNFGKWMVSQRAGARFWREGPGYRFLDLRIHDLWSELGKEFKRKHGLQTEGWIISLENMPLEEIDFIEELPPVPPMVDFMDKARKADVARPLLREPGGFLDQPTPEKFTKLPLAFEHLKGEEKKELIKGYVDGMIEFNKHRFRERGRRSYSEEELKWDPWNKTRIFTAVEILFSSGYLTREQADELEKKHGATRGRVEVGLRGKAVLFGAGGEFLKAVGELLGLKER